MYLPHMAQQIVPPSKSLSYILTTFNMAEHPWGGLAFAVPVLPSIEVAMEVFAVREGRGAAVGEAFVGEDVF